MVEDKNERNEPSYEGLVGTGEVCDILGVTRQTLYDSGMMKVLKECALQLYRHGRYYFQEEKVREWAKAFARRDGLFILGAEDSYGPLIDALKISKENDATCPTCGGWAIADPKAKELIEAGLVLEANNMMGKSKEQEDDFAKRWLAFQKGEYPVRVWCPVCFIGIINNEKKKEGKNDN